MKDKTKKKRISAKKLTAILAPLCAVMLAVAIAAPVVSIGTYDLVMRDFFGEAESKENGSSVEGLDTQYVKSEYSSTDELDAYEKQLVRDMAADGYVLLKNDTSNGKGLPLSTSSSNKTKISLFSHSSVDFIAGGTGSGTGSLDVTLKEAFEAQNYEVNSTLWNFYSTGAGKDYVRGAGSINYGGSENWAINECPLSVIKSNGALSSADGTTAIYVLSRTGGEGRDLGRYMGAYTSIEEDKSKHYLEPDSVELEIIDYLNRNFDNIILLVNTNNVMELGWVESYANIRSVLWCPGGGGQAANSVVDVISGAVNPSGRLVDTMAYDAFSSPAMQNMGDFAYTNNGETTGYYGISYDEGIYVGYKYYETRYFDRVLNQGNAGDYEYSSTVQYPFGYGISYTTFSWSDYSASAPDDDGNIIVSVKITNTGSVAGKEVVGVYLNAPYTDFDKANHLERSAVSLVGYDKTALLNAGESEIVSITVNIEDFILYDDVVNKTYILEEGDYKLTAAANAHAATNNFLAELGIDSSVLAGDGNAEFVSVWTNEKTDTKTYSVSSTGYTITNQFDSSNYIARDKYLTRNDWTGSFPVTHGNQNAKAVSNYSEKNGYTYQEEISSELLSKLQAKGTAEAANSPLTDEEAAKLRVEDSQEGTVELIDIRGAAFNDVDWNSLITQATVKEMQKLVGLAGYNTAKMDSVGKPKTTDLDGPAGLNNMVGHTAYSITYPAEVTIAATWDSDWAEKWADAVAEDGFRDKVDASGWYAPALNIHRTPFAGRNFEYFSEDTFMSGDMAAAAVKGAAKKGMFAYIKHFAVNDQEDHRCDNGIATWLNEQTLREVYLKAFQMAVEDSGTIEVSHYVYDEESNSYNLTNSAVPACTAVMSSFNRIGYTWAGGDYRLITTVLRNEWGFNGTVLTDYSQGATGYMHNAQMLRAGADIALTQYGSSYTGKTDADVYYMQQATKHVLYTVANSNAMNGFIHGAVVAAEAFPYYYLVLIALDTVLSGLTAWAVISIILAFRREKKEKQTQDVDLNNNA